MSRAQNLAQDSKSYTSTIASPRSWMCLAGGATLELFVWRLYVLLPPAAKLARNDVKCQQNWSVGHISCLARPGLFLDRCHFVHSFFLFSSPWPSTKKLPADGAVRIIAIDTASHSTPAPFLKQASQHHFRDGFETPCLGSKQLYTPKSFARSCS